MKLRITQHSVQISTSFLLLVPRPKVRLGLRRLGNRPKLMKTIAVVAAFLLTASAQSLEVRSCEMTLSLNNITQPWTYRGFFEAYDCVRRICLCQTVQRLASLHLHELLLPGIMSLIG